MEKLDKKRKPVHASLFSGFGAADLAALWMGWKNAFWCEIDEFPRRVLSYWFSESTGYENIKETDFSRWRGKIDVLTGGFPCQPFSCAGKRRGADDDRYLWPEMLRAIREIRPAWVVGENVAGILSMVQPGSEVTVESQASLFEEADKETVLDQEYVVETICRDLEREGYSVQPVVIPACAVGAPHRRDRIWFIAHRADAGAESLQCGWKDGVHAVGSATDTDIGRFDNRGDNRKERSVCNDEKRYPEKNQQKRDKWERRTCEDSQSVPDAGSERFLQRESKRKAVGTEASYIEGKWEMFPTQPPVCGRDDGLPFDVVRLTLPFSKWRDGSVKGYGNAMVPQVMYEIFKAIETVTDKA